MTQDEREQLELQLQADIEQLTRETERVREFPIDVRQKEIDRLRAQSKALRALNEMLYGRPLRAVN